MRTISAPVGISFGVASLVPTSRDAPAYCQEAFRDFNTTYDARLARTVLHFPIGRPGKPWDKSELGTWQRTRGIKRSYADEVLAKLEPLKSRFDVLQYGALSVDKKRYPLFAVKSKNWSPDKPYILITGGVHGYETSGVQGALAFVERSAEKYSDRFNIIVAPCVSPWGYETIQRWTFNAVDPNRSFNPNGEIVEGRSFNPEDATEESTALIALLESLEVDQWTCHLDCHETTDTDESEFRPAKAARDGLEYSPGTIPDGFYLVAEEAVHDEDRQAWYTAMIEGVRKVTHIAPADADGLIIGEPVLQDGVIGIPSPKSIGLCAGVTNAHYATTTEVYPDSARATDAQCNDAQVACIEAALDYIIKAKGLQ